MSTASKVLVGFVLGALLLGVASVALGAAAMYRGGTLAVEVHEKGAGGSDVALRLPGILVDVAARFVPPQACRSIPPELRAYGPAIREAALELARGPDGVFVQVASPEESVSIAKDGGDLVVHVKSSSETVRLGIPLRTAASALSRLQAACDSIHP